MKNHLATLLLSLLLPALALAAGPDAVRPDLARHFAAQDLDGCFVVQMGAETDAGIVRVNPERCARRLRPASTFKIVNALTAFEAGVADPALVLKWDGVAREVGAWNRDLTLDEAFRASAVWYFVELGRRNGRERLAGSMRRLEFGTADASGSDQFWIDGPLQVSADEQVRALGRLARGGAGFSARSLAMLRQVMLLDHGPDPDGGQWRLYGKTGLAPHHSDADPRVGWFVGWVEREGKVFPFALNASPRPPAVPFSPEQLAARIALARSLLRELGVLPR